jgi:hypothetical protein
MDVKMLIADTMGMQNFRQLPCSHALYNIILLISLRYLESLGLVKLKVKAKKYEL